ncbi:MAG: hypothetical protein IJI32_03040 [Clostridia bacterium]|nr:hypothetical protein [Clostridia bacterium]
MKMVKRMMIIIVAVAMMFTCSISAFAVSSEEKGEVQIVSSEDQLFFTTKELQEQASGTPSLSKLVVTLERKGSTTTVEVRLSWVATCNTTKVKYSSIQVKSTSAVSPKTYKTFPANTITRPASPIQNVTIGNVTIPKTVASVRVIIKNVSVYFLPDGTAFWSSPRSKNMLIEIRQ